MISSLKIKNKIIAENFGGIGMCLWCCWKDLDEQDSVYRHFLQILFMLKRSDTLNPIRHFKIWDSLKTNALQ